MVGPCPPLSPHRPLPWQFDERQTNFPVDPERGLDTAELTRLLRIHSLQLVMEFTNEVQPVPSPVTVPRGPWLPRSHPPPPPQTSDQIFGAKIPHHMILFLNKSSPEQLSLQDGFRAAAGGFRGEVRCPNGRDMEGGFGTPQPQCPLFPAQVLFVVVDVTGHGADVLPFFGMTAAAAPTLRLVKMENNRKFQMEQENFSDSAIRTFIQAVLDGKVKVRVQQVPARTHGFCPVVRGGLVAQKPKDDGCVVNTRDLFADILLPGLRILRFVMGKGGRRLLPWRHTELGW